MIRGSKENNYICWQGSDLLFIVFGTIVSTFIFASILTMIVDSFSLASDLVLYKPILINLLQFIAMLLSSLLVVAKYRLSPSDLGFQLTNLNKIISWGVVGGVVVCLIVLITNFFLQQILEIWWGLSIPSQPIIEELLSSQDRFIFIAYAFLIVIVAPVVEEIFFRSFLYQYCKKKWGLVRGALIAAFIFGVAHLNLWTFLATFLGGLGLIILYELSKSIYTAIIAHTTWNLVMITIIYLIWYNNMFN